MLGQVQPRGAVLLNPRTMFKNWLDFSGLGNAEHGRATGSAVSSGGERMRELDGPGRENTRRGWTGKDVAAGSVGLEGSAGPVRGSPPDRLRIRGYLRRLFPSKHRPEASRSSVRSSRRTSVSEPVSVDSLFLLSVRARDDYSHISVSDTAGRTWCAGGMDSLGRVRGSPHR